jgi:predicted HicB family RNase H-like nuclease
MNALRYKGYAAHVEFDGEDAIFVGHIAGFHDMVSFHASDLASLEKAFREAVDDYVETCSRIGKTRRES